MAAKVIKKTLEEAAHHGESYFSSPDYYLSELTCHQLSVTQGSQWRPAILCFIHLIGKEKRDNYEYGILSELLLEFTYMANG